LRAEDRGALVVEEVVGDVQQLHQSPGCDGALFQVASQFNLLEMVGPGVTPRRLAPHDHFSKVVHAVAGRVSGRTDTRLGSQFASSRKGLSSGSISWLGRAW
jgi:hypothetical protein